MQVFGTGRFAPCGLALIQVEVVWQVEQSCPLVAGWPVAGKVENAAPVAWQDAQLVVIPV